MRLKLACSCLFGTLYLFVSSGSANVQQRAGDVTLRQSLHENAADRVAALPGAAESFLLELGRGFHHQMVSVVLAAITDLPSGPDRFRF